MTAARQSTYRAVEGWEQLPSGFTHQDCVGVDVDAQDNVYLFTRAQPRVIVYDASGTFLRSWGEDLFTERTHGLTIGPDGLVYCVDEGSNCVYKLTPEGKVLLTIGTNGVGVSGPAAQTGYDGTLESITGGPHFNRPTNVAVAANGDLYVSDGYGNCKVHRFTAAGEHVQSWGEPGTGPGQFYLVHGVAVTADGRVLVADRENDRIQVFTSDGRFLEQWTDVQRPTNVDVGRDGRVYVSELWWRAGQHSYVHGDIVDERHGRVSILDSAGRVLARVGTPDGVAAGSFIAPHDIAVDSRGALYVAEVTYTFAGKAGLVPEDAHTFQKLALAE